MPPIDKTERARRIADLTAKFRELGAEDPEGHAQSEIDEYIPQLARFVFLRRAWECVLPDDGDQAHQVFAQWIAEARRNPGGSCTGAGAALERLMALGASERDLIELVRAAQYGLLFELCYLLDENDPCRAEARQDLPPAMRDIAWKLVQVDDEGRELGEMGSLHEDVLGLDPAGREMRPA